MDKKVLSGIVIAFSVVFLGLSVYDAVAGPSYAVPPAWYGIISLVLGGIGGLGTGLAILKKRRDDEGDRRE